MNTAIICGLTLLASISIVFFSQDISDKIAVWSYQPSPAVLSLANRAGLSENGLFLYLASKPVLDGTQLFNTECDNVENVASILGCYKNSRIFIYDVSDERLDGIKEVTAAHEMLHAAYARLDENEKNRINTLLQSEYEKIRDNVDFKSRMDFYAKTEPGQIDNELHSVIGTEVAVISQELEEYYNKYFIDRQQIIELNKGYLSVFTQLDENAKKIIESRNTLIDLINTRTEEYNQLVNNLDSDIIVFNYKASNAEFESQAQFNQERNRLMDRKNSLNSIRSGILVDIDQSNALLSQYNSIATETKKLFNSLDSSIAPVP